MRVIGIAPFYLTLKSAALSWAIDKTVLPPPTHQVNKDNKHIPKNINLNVLEIG
jgi:hypothetical protein